MSQQTLGVLDHLSIGVVSVPEEIQGWWLRIGWTGAHADKEPKIGKDGKYQFNMYDPDGNRLELMEFQSDGEALLLAVHGARIRSAE